MPSYHLFKTYNWDKDYYRISDNLYISFVKVFFSFFRGNINMFSLGFQTLYWYVKIKNSIVGRRGWNSGKHWSPVIPHTTSQDTAGFKNFLLHVLKSFPFRFEWTKKFCKMQRNVLLFSQFTLLCFINVNILVLQMATLSETVFYIKK